MLPQHKERRRYNASREDLSYINENLTASIPNNLKEKKKD
jgi:hypothetical protein